MIDLSAQISQVDFGEVVGISQPAVSALQSRGVLKQGGTAGDWLLSYCRNLREVAAGRMGEGSAGLDLVDERARLAKEQADKIAMQNAERRGELAPVSAMEMVLASVGSKVGRILDTIPGLIRRRVPGIGSDVVEAVASDLAKVQNMVASMSISTVIDEDEDESQSAEEVIEP